MIGTTLKYTLIAVTAGVIGFTGWTAYEEITQTTSASMSESVQLAQTQAQNMNQALAKVSAIGATGQQPYDQSATLQPSAAQETAPKSFKDVERDKTQLPGASVQRQPTEPGDIAEIANLDTLIAEWRPRYDTAKIAYVKFD